MGTYYTPMKVDDMNGYNGKGHMEPIAIVGMGCRFPGEVSSPSKLWELLDGQRSAQSTIPKNRFNVEAWYHPDSQRPGSVSADGGYFLGQDDSFRGFDPSFFGINPKEAATMDPQQRKLLEVVYECFESSGTTLEKLWGSQTGCFVGCFTTDFAKVLQRDVEYGAAYQVTGGGLTIVSNRINYVFNLKGPSLSIDTACSSSLYALHVACQSLLAGDCTAAVVGGTSIIMDIDQHIDTMRLGVLSPTSTCHTFDESADGFGRAEGIAAIYIKRLSDAISDGDPIRAVIRGTAVNANGRSAGINQPSVTGQEEAIKRAYERAGLRFDKTGYFECHGTGTPVGDRMECAAVGNIFAPGRTADEPLLIGSVKTNLGHCEGASGLAGVMKVVLSLELGQIPATIGIKSLNPNIDFKDGRLRVVRAKTPWPESHKYRRASVNSFGYGGANAHVILDAAESYFGKAFRATGAVKYSSANGCSGLTITKESSKEKELQKLPAPAKKYLLVFSAHDHPTLLRNIGAISNTAAKYEALDLAYTLGVKRSRLHSRAFSITPESSLPEQLEESQMSFGIKKGAEPVLAFAFTGQGAQWPQMGYTLLQHFPSVRRTFEQLEEALRQLQMPPDWSLIDALAEPPKSSRVLETTHSPPLCTAVQIAIVVLLRSWGIYPIAVVGHSSGEVAAAFTAGLLTATEAIAVAYYRGIAVARRHQPGAMMAVGLGAEKAKSFIANQPDVVIACHNSPQSVTLSGGEPAIDKICMSLKKAGIFARKINTSGNAYHSHLVKAAGQYYQECFGGPVPTSASPPEDKMPRVPMYSCIAGKTLEPNQVGIGYWRLNLESPVLFDKATQNLLESHPLVNHIVEIGPHSALAGPIRQIRSSLGLDAEQLTYLPTLVRGQDGVENLLRLGGALFTSGYPVAVERVNSIETINPSSAGDIHYRVGSLLVDLPTYQWNYESLPWHESRRAHELRFRSHCRHDLLGSREPGSSLNWPLWHNMLSLKHVPWLRDHKIGSDIIFPAAGYMAMAVESVTQVAEDRMGALQGYTFQRLSITSPLVLSEEVEVETLFNLRALNHLGSKDATKWFDFKVSSVGADGKWTEHAAGMIAIQEINTDHIVTNTVLQGHRGSHSKQSSDRRWYSALSSIGLNYGPAFQTLSDIRTTAEDDEATARIALHNTKDSMLGESRYVVHPSTLDGCLQLSNIAAQKGNVKNIVKAYLPVTIERMTIWRQPKSMPPSETANIRAHGVYHGLRSVRGSAEVFDDEGRVLVRVEASFFSIEGGISRETVGKPRQPYLRLVWKPDIDRLKGPRIRELFPSGSRDPVSLSHMGQLEKLAALCILDSGNKLPKDLQFGNQASSVGNFAKWLETRDKNVERHWGGQSATERRNEIQEITSDLGSNVPEVRLIAKLNDRMPELLKGTIDPLDTMLEGGLLNHIYEHGLAYEAAHLQLINVVRLIAHKQPRLTVLEVGAGTGGATRAMMDALHGNSLQPHYTHYTFTDLDPTFLWAAQEKFLNFKNMEFRMLDIEGDPLQQGFEESSYDLILAADVINATGDTTTTLRHCKSLLKPGGKLVIIETAKDTLFRRFMLGMLPEFWRTRDDGQISSPFISESDWNTFLLEAGFSGNDIVLDDYAEPHKSTNVIVSTAEKLDTVENERNGFALSDRPGILWLVYRHEPHQMVREIKKVAAENGIETESVNLSAAATQISRGSRIIVLAELEGPVLSQMSRDEMSALKILMSIASSAIWVTNGGLLAGKSPEKSLIFGLVKTIMTEKPSIRLSSIDVDPNETCHRRSAGLVIDQELKLKKDSRNQVDNHVIEKDGIVYISRYIPDDVENARFARQLIPVPEKLKFESGLSVDFLQVGEIDGFYFKHTLPTETILEAKQVQLQPLSYSLSRTEALILKGQYDSRSFSHECMAVVTRVGPYVTKIKAGDRVICLTPGKFDSALVVHEDVCQKLFDDQEAQEMAGLVIPSCTALHALVDIGRIRDGETVLVHLPADPISIVAIFLVQSYTPKVLVTFNSEDEKECLQNTYAVPKNSLFDANSTSLTNDLMAATGGQGIDIILTGMGVSGLDGIWTCLARNGRFVLTGGADVPNLGLFDVSVLSRGASLSSFDFLRMISAKPAQTARIVQNAFTFYRDRSSFRPFTAVETFDIAELPNAVQAATRSTRFGRVLLKCSSDSIVPVQPAYKPLTFNTKATYLLIGCLGGLGRSLASWMTTRGARHFIFLSRSGADKSEAATFLQELHQLSEKLGNMTIQIVRGDVSARADVDKAISVAKSPIKGVIQAAMCLEDCLFENMSLETWNSVIHPKVLGTIHLHEALLTESLDFFVMTSSVITAIGTSTQSNYSAANSFLDSMARHRRSMGLQATSIALGMIVEVGHVEAHPEVAAALKKNGMHGIDEDEYLRIMELACRPSNPDPPAWDWDELASSYILTGLEPGRISKVAGKTLWLEDNRLRHVKMAMDSYGNELPVFAASATPTSRILQAAAAKNGEAGVKDAVRDLVLEKFSQLVLVPTEKLALSMSKPLAEFGMDSMIGTEIRTWSWRELRSDVPFMSLLDTARLVGELVEMVWEGMDSSLKASGGEL